MKKIRGYIFSRPFMGERVPQHVQNLVIRNYCERNNLHYLLSATEYAMHNCSLIYEQVMSELPEIDGIAAYSLFQMPEDFKYRLDIYQRVMDAKKELHFAVEGLQAITWIDVERIEVLWSVRKILPRCISKLV